MCLITQQTNSHTQPVPTAVTTITTAQSADFCTRHMSAAKVSPGKSSVLLADNAALREATGERACSGPHARPGVHTKPAHGSARGEARCVRQDTVLWARELQFAWPTVATKCIIVFKYK